MSLRINDIAPDFTANTTQGEISFHDWIGDGWGQFCFHTQKILHLCALQNWTRLLN